MEAQILDQLSQLQKLVAERTEDIIVDTTDRSYAPERYVEELTRIAQLANLGYLREALVTYSATALPEVCLDAADVAPSPALLSST